MNQSEDAGAYSLMDISMLFLAPLCLARPDVTPLPSSDSLLTECLFLIAQASLSIFGSFSAWHDVRSRIRLVMLYGFPQCTQPELLYRALRTDVLFISKHLTGVGHDSLARMCIAITELPKIVLE